MRLCAELSLIVALALPVLPASAATPPSDPKKQAVIAATFLAGHLYNLKTVGDLGRGLSKKNREFFLKSAGGGVAQPLPEWKREGAQVLFKSAGKELRLDFKNVAERELSLNGLALKMGSGVSYPAVLATVERALALSKTGWYSALVPEAHADALYTFKEAIAAAVTWSGGREFPSNRPEFDLAMNMRVQVEDSCDGGNIPVGYGCSIRFDTFTCKDGHLDVFNARQVVVNDGKRVADGYSVLNVRYESPEIFLVQRRPTKSQLSQPNRGSYKVDAKGVKPGESSSVFEDPPMESVPYAIQCCAKPGCPEAIAREREAIINENVAPGEQHPMPAPAPAEAQHE